MYGPFPGQILTAVGIDPNNGTYAVVEAETKDSWCCFLENLGDDLDLGRDSNFTFITDRQKGLIPALGQTFPCAEHRYCLKHIHDNMKSVFRGKLYKDHLWKCATSTTIVKFVKNMEELKLFNIEAYKWLKQIPPQHWTRSHFSVIGKCNGPLTPNATKLFEAIKKDATQYRAIWNGQEYYQVYGPFGDQCVVNMQLRSCTCRKWELTGIPCKHGVAAIWNKALNSGNTDIPETYVHPCYWLKTWEDMYKYKIVPVNGKEMWRNSNVPSTLIPPVYHVQTGRPKKTRRKSAGELLDGIVKGGKMSRAGKRVTCTICKEVGHNRRGCKIKTSEPGTSQAGNSQAGTLGNGGSNQPSQAAAPVGSQAAAPVGSQAGGSQPSHVASGTKFTKSTANRMSSVKPTKSTAKRVADIASHGK